MKFLLSIFIKTFVFIINNKWIKWTLCFLIKIRIGVFITTKKEVEITQAVNSDHELDDRKDFWDSQLWPKCRKKSRHRTIEFKPIIMHTWWVKRQDALEVLLNSILRYFTDLWNALYSNRNHGKIQQDFCFCSSEVMRNRNWNWWLTSYATFKIRSLVSQHHQ